MKQIYLATLLTLTTLTSLNICAFNWELPKNPGLTPLERSTEEREEELRKQADVIRQREDEVKKKEALAAAKLSQQAQDPMHSRL